jgi:glyoxylase-like metal-dependent hydrolase (beta-lactamase superfamily II)
MHMHTEHFIFNELQTRCSLVWDDKGFCAIVDPGYKDAEKGRIVAFIEQKKLTPVCVLLTHGHFDHIYGLADFVHTYKVPVYMDRKEVYSFEKTNPYVCSNYGLELPEIPAEESFRYVSDSDVIEVGDLRFDVLETPGHSAGGLCFLEKNGKTLFSGDTLFAGAIGRSDHPGGDYDVLMKSIWEKVMCLDGDIQVIAGHGPNTDIATERMTNPFLLPFNEPYEE